MTSGNARSLGSRGFECRQSSSGRGGGWREEERSIPPVVRSLACSRWRGSSTRKGEVVVEELRKSGNLNNLGNLERICRLILASGLELP